MNVTKTKRKRRKLLAGLILIDAQCTVVIDLLSAIKPGVIGTF